MEKTVLKPIKVPSSNYCWEQKPPFEKGCEHFNNEGGHPMCEENLGGLEYDEKNGGVRKCDKCLKLIDV